MHVRMEPILLVALKLHALYEVTSCAPGQSYTPATNIEDGRCDACADGTYSAGGTETTCTPHEVTSCAPGQSYTPATNIEDGRCDACADGTYSADGTSCIDHTVLSCAPGHSIQQEQIQKTAFVMHVRTEPILLVALKLHASS